jgi:ABC-type phosphate transport system permease subunit
MLSGGDVRLPHRQQRRRVRLAAEDGAFIAAGLVLFILTFVVNAVARVVIERRKAFTE